MRAVTWQGVRDVRVEDVPDPRIEQPTDAVVRITSSGVCGSDLHLYETLGPFMGQGNILGHEPMGIVEEVGSAVTAVKVGDRVVLPFQISCGHCWMCEQGLQTQCETTQVREQGTGAALYGFSRLYGEVPGGQAEYLRTPLVDANAVVVPDGPPDERFLFLSDVLPTAWQSVEYADIPDGGTVVVMGAGPIGDMASRIAAHRGHRVITVDLVPERLERVRAHGAETHRPPRRRRPRRGGARAHAGPRRGLRHRRGRHGGARFPGGQGRPAGGRLPARRRRGPGDDHGRGGPPGSPALGDRRRPPGRHDLGDRRLRRHGRPDAVDDDVRQAAPLRMGQANVRRWVPDILPLLTDEDPLGVDDFATHTLPLEEAAHGYRIFQAKEDGACKVVLKP